jgi:hypothetical protein
MKIELIVQSKETGQLWEISELVSDISWDTYITDQPGKLTFNFIDEDNKVLLPEGSIVSFKVDDTKVFFGYVFKNGCDESSKVQITAYDQLRYLKNKDVYVIPGMTSSQIFEKICKETQLRYSVLDASSYVLPASVEDNKTYYEVIQKSIDLTLINTGKWYFVRDNFGTLEYQLINRLKTPVFIGDGSLLSKYSFESSIDEDTYNQIKLVKEDKDAKKREIYIVKDSNTIETWGTLQYFEKMDEDSNAAQIQARAEMLLKLKNRATKTLKLGTVIGDLRVFAGAGVILGIQKLVPRGIELNKYFMVTSVSHTFKNDSHTMSPELQVSI